MADDPYPNLRFSGGADWQHESQAFLQRLDAAARAAGDTLDVFSAYRSPAYSASVGGYANDPHTRGVAVDANVGGQPAGQAISQSLLARFGLESGNQPNFYRGQPDPSHIQVSGSGVDKSISAANVSAPASGPVKPGISPDEVTFVKGVAGATGIDTRVLIAWIQSEGHPGDLYHNYLNITADTARSLHEPLLGTAAAGTAIFATGQTGIDATVKEIKALGLTNLAGESPKSQISMIAASPWASGHYGGPGGPALRNVFNRLYPGQIGLPGQDDTTVGGPSITDVGPNLRAGVGDIPGISTVGDAIAFLTSWRFAEVLGGFLLLIVGLLLLGKSLGIGVPRTPLDRYASSQPTSREGTGARRTRSYTLEADRPAPKRPAPSVDYGDVPY